MRPVEIKKDVYWVGAVDWNTIDFHGYSLAHKGTTYNSYLVLDDKITLFDTVKPPFKEQFLETISQVVDPCKIDYIVSNHLEPDHGGLLPDMIATCAPEKVFCSPLGQRSIEAHFHPQGWPLEVVKSGDTLSLGKRDVHFLETRMIHWPDSMVSYIPQDKLLISQDAFGQNIASTERYSDQINPWLLEELMAHYYANIVLPYSPQVLKVLGQIADMGLDIDMIAPDHGLIHRGEAVGKVLELYKAYAEQKPANRALLIYDSMWHSTDRMAEAICDGLVDEGVSAKLMHLKSFHHSDVQMELFRSGALLAGSPTHNNGILPLMADALTYIKGLRPQNKVGAAFGSFGWSGECIKILGQWLQDAGIEVVDPGVKHKHVPDADALASCAELGRTVGKALKTKL